MTTSNVNRSGDTTSEGSGRNRRRTNEERADAIFDVLSDARRRRTIRILQADEGTVSMPALAEALAAREPGDPDPDRLAVSLQHVHLPKLEATGIVEYTSDRSRVQYGGGPLVERLLEQV
jgi:DNA-binding transcriptional ArsR family regulator